MDDLLRFNNCFPEHVAEVCAVLLATRKSGITFSLKKFQFARTQLQWVGFQIQPGGISVDPEKLRAISDFPKPTNITELRYFIGHRTNEAPGASNRLLAGQIERHHFMGGKLPGMSGEAPASTEGAPNARPTANTGV